MELFADDEIDYTSENGFDQNIRFPKKPCSFTTITSLKSESEDLSESTCSRLDTTVVPFSTLWCFGVNTTSPFINLTKEEKLLFFASSHVGILYNYETREMKHFIGHQNAISTMTVEKSGKYLATADCGDENCIIVWNLYKCKPICTIFNANEGSGTALLGFSGNGKYLVSVSDTPRPTVKFWLWTYDASTPFDEFTVSKNYGDPVAIEFNPQIQEHFMVAFEKQVIFLQWNTENGALYEEFIPAIRNRSRMGTITDCTYIDECHECIATTTEGCAVVFGNSLYVSNYKADDPFDNRKMYVKTVKLSKTQINCVTSVDGIFATGDVRGFVKFYDKNLKLLYWCQSFNLPPIKYIRFNLEPRTYKLEDPLENLCDEHFVIPSPRKIIDGEYDDVSEDYEILFRGMVPSDATIHKHPFIVRDFILATGDGNLVKVDYMNNSVEALFGPTDSEVAAIDIHAESPYILITYRSGRITLYHYETHELITTTILPEASMKLFEKEEDEFEVVDEKPSIIEKSMHWITTVKYSPKCYHLAIGRGNGEIWFLDPIMLTLKSEIPYNYSLAAIKKMIFSVDCGYFAYYDCNRTVCIFKYAYDTEEYVLVGKIRSHYKELTDMVFSSDLPSELYSIGLDRYLVKYDLETSENGQINIESRIRIDQSSQPNAFLFYPLLDGKFFLIADNQFKLKIFNADTNIYHHVFLGPAYGCYSEAPINRMDLLPDSGSLYLIFSTEKHIGIEKLPPDGNPYKYTGTIAHPKKLIDYCLSPCGQYIFTAGADDACVLKWRINPQAVENLTSMGGKELEPFFCLIEGGSNGWLFTEMQNLFYYMQILHQGENSQLPRKISDCVDITEVPDLMRACGYYPSEYEVEIMLHDAKFQNQAQDSNEEEVSFIDFIRLYINHRPAHGISMEKLEAAFSGFCELGDYTGAHISGEEFPALICREGEKFTEEAARKTLSILLRCSQEDDDAEVEDFSFMPQDIDFETFVGEILGIDMGRSIIN